MATQTPSQGFEDPPSVRRRGFIWLWSLKLEETCTSWADFGLGADLTCGGRAWNVSWGVVSGPPWVHTVAHG